MMDLPISPLMGVAVRVLQKCFAEELIGSVGKKAFFEFALLESLFLVFALVVLEVNDKPPLPIEAAW